MQRAGMIGGMPTGAAITSVQPGIAPIQAANPAITANTTVTPIQQPMMAPAQTGAPPIGLIGAEQVLNQGKTAAELALMQGYGGAEDMLARSYGGAEGMLTQAYDGAGQDISQGFGAAGQALDASYWAARSESDKYRQALNNRTLSLDATPSADVINPLNEAVANFDPYMKTGQSADRLYADLTGANGAEAQATAQAAYESSPALQYQIDQMQKVTERSAAARGGLLGGRVALELQKNAQGLTSQDYFKNLAALDAQANRGVTAAGQVGGIRSNQAGIAASLQGQKMQAQTQYEIQKEQIRNDVAQRLTSLAENYGINKAGLGTESSKVKAGLKTDLGQTVAGLRSDLGRTGAGFRADLGQSTAGLNTGFSQVVGGMREGAGYAVAQNANQAAGNISSILQNQGIQVSEMMGKDIASLTDMIYQSGMQDKTDMQNLAAILANITGGQASNVMQGQSTIGAAQAAGTVGAANAVTQGIGTYLGTTGGKK